MPQDFPIIALSYGKLLMQCDELEEGKGQGVNLRFLIDEKKNVHNHKISL